MIEKHKIRVRVLGAPHLLPPLVLEAAQNVERMTRHNTGATLNICSPYTSRHEMATAVASAVEGVE
ncbi:hypothetical protein BDK51DRAFT_5013, partial [Blyttiomyces helicus]